ncbi:unnamed protein product [Chrysoparadoxa australica]
MLLACALLSTLCHAFTLYPGTVGTGGGLRKTSAAGPHLCKESRIGLRASREGKGEGSGEASGKASKASGAPKAKPRAKAKAKAKAKRKKVNVRTEGEGEGAPPAEPEVTAIISGDRVQQDEKETPDAASPRRILSLQDLNKHLDGLLRKQESRKTQESSRARGRESFPQAAKKAAGAIQQNGREPPQEEEDDTYQIAVLLGKHLVRDQVTLEYASRIRRLVQCIKNNVLKPNLVCFTGGRVGSNTIGDAAAGFVFFRQLSEHQEVDISEMSFFVEQESTCTKEAMKNVALEVLRLKGEEETKTESDFSRRKLAITLISNEYHLSRISDVQRLSPRRSMLAPVVNIGASWALEYATYPYTFSNEEETYFRAKLYILMEELVPLLVNLQGLAEKKEFFQMDNYETLMQVRKRLNESIDMLHSNRCPVTLPTTKLDMRNLLSRGQVDASAPDAPEMLDEALERTASVLSEIQVAVKPAAFRTDSVSAKTWQKCATALEEMIWVAQRAVDPDRPLKAHVRQNDDSPSLSHETSSVPC